MYWFRGSGTSCGKWIRTSRQPEFKTPDETIAQDLASERLFGAVTLQLAAIGLYGVMSFGVARRQGEIGIRMALGARGLVWLALRETLLLAFGGLVIGVIASFWVMRLTESMLFDLRTHRPGCHGNGGYVDFLHCGTCAYLPARRAVAFDPMTALREE